MDSRTGCLVPTGRDSNDWVVCVVGVGDGALTIGGVRCVNR